jgi:hypothetical protein
MDPMGGESILMIVPPPREGARGIAGNAAGRDDRHASKSDEVVGGQNCDRRYKRAA